VLYLFTGGLILAGWIVDIVRISKAKTWKEIVAAEQFEESNVGVNQ
jgi:hypothetical protein